MAGRPRASARVLRLARRALQAHRRLPPDTHRLHAHFANYAATTARYLSLLSGLPYAVTAHAYDIYQEPFLLAPNLAGADHVFTISRANVEHLAAIARADGWDPARLELLRCGVDLGELAYRDAGAPRRPARLVCVARLVPKKGHALLLDAIAQLRGAGVAVELEIVGEGPLLEALRERAGRPDLVGAVRFAGPLPPDEALARLAGADLAVLASRVAADGDRDGLPVSLIEALALGTPAVSTTVAGIPELVHEETGWPAPPDRADLLASAIREALAAPDAERHARARRGRALVEREFDLARQVARLKELVVVSG